jgi:3-oxoacyl-(acyl-carrier-protein) synthase
MRNLDVLAEDCAELDYVVGQPSRSPDLEAALCMNLGIGGHNVAIVLERA